MSTHTLSDQIEASEQSVVFPKTETIDSIMKTLPKLPPVSLLDVWQFVQFQAYKSTLLGDKRSENELLWAAVQREQKYRVEHPEDVIICNSMEELDAVLELADE